MRPHSILSLMCLVLGAAVVLAVLRSYGVEGIVLLGLFLMFAGGVLLYSLVVAALVCRVYGAGTCELTRQFQPAAQDSGAASEDPASGAAGRGADQI